MLKRSRVSITRAGVELVGEATSNNPDVLLLHAGGESRKVWHPVRTLLARNNIHSIAYDQRGHGESGSDIEDGLSAFGEDTIAMISSMSRPVVVGASLGGFALMLVLNEIQKNIAGLILVDIVPSPNPEYLRKYLSIQINKHTLPLINDILFRSNELSRNISSVSLPMMLVRGSCSNLGKNHGIKFSCLAPHAQIETVEGAGHLIAQSNPRELAKHISDFTNRLDVLARRLV